MSLRLKTIAALNVLGWLVAVPLLGAALLGPIVGFGGWPDRLLPGGDDALQLAGPPAAHAEAPANARSGKPGGAAVGLFDARAFERPRQPGDATRRQPAPRDRAPPRR